MTSIKYTLVSTIVVFAIWTFIFKHSGCEGWRAQRRSLLARRFGRNHLSVLLDLLVLMWEQLLIAQLIILLLESIALLLQDLNILFLLRQLLL